MSQARLRWLLPLMLGLGALRGWDAWMASRQDAASAPAVSAAVDRPEPVAAAPTPRPDVVAAPAPPVAPGPGDETIPDVFSIRLPPAPPAAPVPAPPSAPEPFVGPPVPPPPPPPPPPPALQVIGTWRDAAGVSAFVSNNAETVQARPGDLLFGQYRVTQLTADRLVIHDPARASDFTYPVPRVDARPNPPPHP